MTMDKRGETGPMHQVRTWLGIATTGAVLRRGALTSAVVGTILTLVNHGGELMRTGLRDSHVVPIAFTFAVPFAVSLVSSVAAIRANGSRS